MKSEVLKIKVKNQLLTKLIFYVGIAFLTYLFLSYGSYIRVNSGYFISFLFIYGFICFRFYKTIGETHKIELYSSFIYFVTKSRNRRFARFRKKRIRYKDIVGLDYDEDNIYIETSSTTYRLDTIALVGFDSLKLTRELESRAGMKPKASMSKLSIFDRSII